MSYLNLGQYSAAISYLEETINISEELGELRQLKEANKQLSVAYEEIGDFDKALDSYKKYVAIADSLLKEKEKETLAALQRWGLHSPNR